MKLFYFNQYTVDEQSTRVSKVERTVKFSEQHVSSLESMIPAQNIPFYAKRTVAVVLQESFTDIDK